MALISRRAAGQSFAAGAALSLLPEFARATESVAVRTITKGPKHHWFGYYDKLEFDPTDRFVLSNEVGFEHRTPKATDTIRVGMVDTHNDDKWIGLGQSQAWGWQQGCMLQWRPSAEDGKTEVVWNDREGDKHVCRVLDVNSMQLRTLPKPIYSLSPDGKSAITADFSRIQRMRPGYGYVGLEDPYRDDRAPRESGVWKMDMNTGKSQLIFSLADAAEIPHRGKSLDDKWHYFNHLLVSPDSNRFIVLHRWRSNGEDSNPTGGFTTRMFTVAMDGSERYILDPSGHTSHFIWRDSRHVCAWTKPLGKRAAFYVFQDQTRDFESVGEGVMTRNGHNTYVPNTDNEWILNDTYPDRVTREQKPYLFHVPSGKKVELGGFRSPPEYKGEWRCDTHPRSSNDGKTVAIDSPHTGTGRQVHLIDVSRILG